MAKGRNPVGTRSLECDPKLSWNRSDFGVFGSARTKFYHIVTFGKSVSQSCVRLTNLRH